MDRTSTTASPFPNSTVPHHAHGDEYETSDSIQVARLGLLSYVQNITVKAESTVKQIWFEVCQWTTTYFSDISVRLAPRLPTVAVSSAFNSGVTVVQESFDSVVQYCDRVYRYLQAAREYEIQQRSNTSVPFVTSRGEVIEAIALRAGLRPEEIPYVALTLEGLARNVDRWNYGPGLLMQAESLWQRVETLWQRLLRSLQRVILMVMLPLIGINLFQHGRFLRILGWLFIIIIAFKLDKMATWLAYW